MRVLLRKLNNKMFIISTMVFGLIVLVCAVFLYDATEIEAADDVITRNYGIVINLTSGNNSIEKIVSFEGGTPTDAEKTIIYNSLEWQHNNNNLLTFKSFNFVSSYPIAVKITSSIEEPFGILVDKGTTNISGGTITTKAYGDNACGIKSSEGIINISGGDFIARIEGEGAKGLWAHNGESTIDNANIQIEAYGDDARGILVDNSQAIHLNSGHIETDIYGTKAMGVYFSGALTVGTNGQTSGPTIIVRGDIHNNQVDDYSVAGICIIGDMTVYNGNIVVDLKNTVDKYIAGIKTQGDFLVEGGTLDINVDVLHTDGTYGMSDGISSIGTMTINGGHIISKTNGLNAGDVSGRLGLNGSAGMYAGGTLTINNGVLEVRNTNETETQNKIAWGLYADSSLAIKGGHIVVQGNGQAIYSKDGQVNISYTNNIDNQTIGVFASINFDGSDLGTYNSTYNSNYKYVECGVIYDYFFRYKASDNKMYRGDVTDSNGNPIEVGSSTLSTLGITITPGQGNNKTDKLTFSDTFFQSNSGYGLIIEGSAIIHLTQDTQNKILANVNESGIGISCKGTLTIEGEGQLITSGKSQGIYLSNSTTNNNMTFTNGAYYDMKVLEVSEDYTGINSI